MVLSFVYPLCIQGPLSTLSHQLQDVTFFDILISLKSRYILYFIFDVLFIWGATLCSLSEASGSAGKESTCNVGNLGLIPGLGRSPGEGKGYPLHYSSLENSIDCIVHGVPKSRTRLSNFHFPCSIQDLSSPTLAPWSESSES